MIAPRTTPTLVALAAAALLAQPAEAQQNLALALFDRYLDSLRQQAGIPGLSAIILQHGTVVWDAGYGLQNVERAKPATPNTPYMVAGLTEVVSSALTLQCVERGMLNLSDSAHDRGASQLDAHVTVGDLLSHITPDGFRYDAARFAALSPVISECAGKPLPRAVADGILDRFGMAASVPGADVIEPGAPSGALFGAGAREHYRAVLSELAVPYRVERSGKASRADQPGSGLNAATGLVSTVRDLARFVAALDNNALIGANWRAAAWSRAADGSAPTGLGWFVQQYRGTPVVWHFGILPDAYSSLIIKLPHEGLTLVLLANSDGLNASFPLERGDVTTSVFAQLFLRTFVP